MTQPWLKTNRRILALLLGLCLGMTLLAAAIFWLSHGQTSLSWLQIVAASVGAMAFAMALAMLWAMRRPRVAATEADLLLYLKGIAPIRVPLEAVEGFLLGQGPSYLPGKQVSRLETSTLVIKLAERYPQWERVSVATRLASWCGHYVTLRGTWCEPLSVALVHQLNARLAEARAAHATRTAHTSRA